MEEIITLDGKQFKLTTDRPLTALERQQTISQIRQQTGCSSCNQPRTLSTGYDIYSMLDTCSTATKGSGQTITMTAAPDGGVGPYVVKFWRKLGGTGGTYVQVGSTQSGVTEAYTVTQTYTLIDFDVSSALGDTSAGTPSCDTAGVISDPFDGGKTLAAAKIRVATTVTDSCPTGTPQVCTSSCDVNLACVAPTCNFVVS